MRKQLEHELRKLEYLQNYKLATWGDQRRIFEIRRQLAEMDFEDQEAEAEKIKAKHFGTLVRRMEGKL